MEVDLVAADDAWDLVSAARREDLVVEHLHLLKGASGGDGIDQDVPVDADGVGLLDRVRVVLRACVRVSLGVWESERRRSREEDERCPQCRRSWCRTRRRET